MPPYAGLDPYTAYTRFYNVHARFALQNLADKYETNTACMYRKVCVFLRRTLRARGLKDPSVILHESTKTHYGAMIQLDVERLEREGLTTWRKFEAAYLR